MMLEQRSKDPLKSRGLLGVAIRARKYQVGCLIFILLLVLTQVFFGFLTLPLFPKHGNGLLSHLSSWTNISAFLDRGLTSVAENGPDVFFDALPPRPATQPPTCKKWNLLACAMVHNEAAYLMEWIEFHRLQGVDHFVFYTYFSVDLLEYIPMLYENADVYKLVDVIPARFFSQDPKRNLTAADYVQNREWSMIDCNVRYGKHANWLLMMDAGHFVYSNAYNNITDFLIDQTEQQANNTSIREDERFTAVKIPTVRFGTSGVKDKFQTWLTPNAFTGGADLNYEPYLDSPDLYPLVIESNPRRAPHRELDANFTDLPVCRDPELLDGGDDLQLCSDASVVTLVRSGRCVAANISECLRPTVRQIWPELSVLRADNHNWRAVNHVLNAKYWDFQHNKTFEALDKAWFSLVVDKGKFRFIEPIREAIAKVKPRIFLDVNRTCRADAMQNGQQIMCPQSHPYPFGNLGIKWLRDCCATDKDAGGNPLKLESNSCFNNSVVECPDPPSPDVTKWIHRSCCIWTPLSPRFN